MSPARCYTKGAWTQFAVLEAARGCCVGDPGIGGSEIRGEMCWKLERTKETIDREAMEAEGEAR